MANRCSTLVSRALCYGLVVLFAWMGLSKIVAPEAAERAFVSWGFPEWFPALVGVLELLGAILLTMGTTTTLGAALLGGIMLGAVATHLVHAEYARAALPALVLVPIACVGFCRRLEATWMRRVSAPGALAERESIRRHLGANEDRAIIPGLPELRLTGHADVPDAVGERKRRA